MHSRFPFCLPMQAVVFFGGIQAVLASPESVSQTPGLLRMNLTRVPTTVFDPLRAAIQLGLKYGGGSGSSGSSGSATSIAYLTKQLELAYLNTTALGDSDNQGIYSFLDNAKQPVQLHGVSPLSKALSGSLCLSRNAATQRLCELAILC
jgi:hypothetical protein